VAIEVTGVLHKADGGHALPFFSQLNSSGMSSFFS
jgi:hypothetical protein